MSPRRRSILGRPPGNTSDATRSRVLSAARECFARRGYAGTTNKDIAERAGVTAAAIYQYFDSKAALYMATVREAQAILVVSFRAAAAHESSARGALEALVRASGELHAKDPSITAFLSALPVELRREEEVARAMAEAPSEVVEIVAEIVERGVLAGEIAAGAAPHVVSMFLACLMGLSLYAATIDDGEFSSTIASFIALMEGTLVARRATRAPNPKPARRVARGRGRG